MAVRKLSISLDQEVADRAARLAEEQGTTLSSVIGQSLQDRFRVADGRAAMREWDVEDGPVPDAALERADRLLDDLGIRPRR
ncbi:MAG: hypothetical protein AB7G37_11350 [Solirubrobacteraceae bacterium]